MNNPPSLRAYLAPVLAALLATAVSAQARVADIWPGPNGGNPTNLVAMGGSVYFLATTAAAGTELWRSDGTAAGTYMVKDINPNSGVSGFPASPEFQALDDRIVFVADDGVHGQELWLSDGTTAGTAMIVDAYPGSIGSLPRMLTRAGPRVFFQMSTQGFGAELWVSDGTAAGTHLVTDLNPGPGSGIAQSGRSIGAFGDNVYFSGTNHGLQQPCLCFSDGTTAGIVSTAPTYPNVFVTYDDGQTTRVVFYATGAGNGSEPWITDGTAAGTFMLRDIEPGTGSSVGGNGTSFLPVVFGGRVHFIARSTAEGIAHWVSDGTSAGTQLFFAPFLADPLAWVRGLFVAGDRLYLEVYTSTTGDELYVTDGTATPTLVTDFNPGTGVGFYGLASWRAVGTGRVALTTLQRGPSGYEPGVTDGTVAGTRILADLAPVANNGSQPREYTRVGDLMFFSAQDDGQAGRELYALDVRTIGAADLLAYGTGCPGTGGAVPTLGGNGAPRLGNAAFGVRLAQGRPSSACGVFLSGSSAAIPAGTCTILVAPGPNSFFGTTDAQGALTLPLPIPANQALVGLELFLQGMVLDPAGALFGSASASAGLRIRLGS